jgi:hypothetical protein
MAQDYGHHLVHDILLVGQSLQKASRRVLACGFMPAGGNAPVILSRGGWFAKVMTEHTQSDDHIVLIMTGSLSSEPVQTVECMDPDIAFGVPNGILWTALNGCELRVEAQPPTVAQEV